MFTLSYTKSATLTETLMRIDLLRTQILTTPLPIKSEQRLMFRSSVYAAYTELSLAGIPLTIDEIIAIRTATKQYTSATGIAVISYQNALLWIAKQWSGNMHPILAGDMQVLATILFTKPSRIDREFTRQKEDIASLSTYLSTLSDHPVIRAGLVHAFFLSHPVSPTDHGIFASLMNTLVRSQYGYTLRGMATHMMDIDDAKRFAFAKETIQTYGQCTQWLEYVAESVEATYKRLLLTLIKESRTGTKDILMDRVSELTKREEDIMTLVLVPNAKITNRQIQLRFHISAITSSRHLKKLTALGFLFAHGKGRSVYYTRT